MSQLAQRSTLEEPELGGEGERLAQLESDLRRRERELASVKVELQTLQGQYLQRVGVLYAELTAIEAAIADAEGRTCEPVADDDDALAEEGADADRAAPSDTLKRVFRDVAKAIHPDLALDEPARCRRHSLMAEANRAYAERDEDRLRLILGKWEANPDAPDDEDPLAHWLPVPRRIALIEARLRMIDAELSDLADSAVSRLKRRIDETRAQGWDLMAEMILQMKREIATANARLVSLSMSPTS
jgi:hypothetical protein